MKTDTLFLDVISGACGGFFYVLFGIWAYAYYKSAQESVKEGSWLGFIFSAVGFFIISIVLPIYMFMHNPVATVTGAIVTVYRLFKA